MKVRDSFAELNGDKTIYEMPSGGLNIVSIFNDFIIKCPYCKKENKVTAEFSSNIKSTTKKCFHCEELFDADTLIKTELKASASKIKI